jgi:cell division protease FtsH
LPEHEKFMMSRDEFMDKIRGLLGGRAAEETFFGGVTTGAEDDLEHATALVRQMICVYGMGDSVGLLHCAEHRDQFLPINGDGLTQRNCSEQTARAKSTRRLEKFSTTPTPTRRRSCRNTALKSNCWLANS